MRKLLDAPVGARFGMWTVTGHVQRGVKHPRIPARCDCGKEFDVILESLIRRTSNSCGCVHRQRLGQITTTHGLTKIPEYDVWNVMRGRCSNPGDRGYKNYGGRGITVDPRWEKFVNFFEDMGPRPTSKHSLDRIDNDGPYSPDNCRWATKAEQMANRQGTKYLHIGTRTIARTLWAAEHGFEKSLVSRATNKFGTVYADDWELISLMASLAQPPRPRKKVKSAA